jgi:hypothetical protein
MKPLRVILATLVGAILIFAWGALSHMVLPFGEMGVKSLPSESTLLPILQEQIKEPGFYVFPGMSNEPSQAEQDAWSAKYRTGPIGVLAFQPTGREPMSPMQLGTEFASNLAAAFIAALLIAAVGGGLPRGLAVGFALALFEWLSLMVSHWNWYAFPLETIVGELAIEAIGWTFAGAVMGLVAGRRASRHA